MGERILRPGIRTSDGMAKAIRAGGGMQVGFTFTLLLTVADDYGRYDGRAAILRAELFPLLGDMVRESDLERWLQALQSAGLIRLYSLDGKRYLEIQQFRQRMRAAKSKWPAPDDVTRPHADAGKCHDIVTTLPTDTDTEQGTDTEQIPFAAQTGGGKAEKKSAEPAAESVPIPDTLNTPGFREAWESYLGHRRQMKKKLTPNGAAAALKRLAEHGVKEATRLVEVAVANGWQGVVFDKPTDRGSTNGKPTAQHRSGQFEQTVKLKAFQPRGGGSHSAGDGRGTPAEAGREGSPAAVAAGTEDPGRGDA